MKADEAKRIAEQITRKREETEYQRRLAEREKERQRIAEYVTNEKDRVVQLLRIKIAEAVERGLFECSLEIYDGYGSTRIPPEIRALYDAVAPEIREDGYSVDYDPYSSSGDGECAARAASIKVTWK